MNAFDLFRYHWRTDSGGLVFGPVCVLAGFALLGLIAHAAG